MSILEREGGTSNREIGICGAVRRGSVVIGREGVDGDRMLNWWETSARMTTQRDRDTRLGWHVSHIRTRSIHWHLTRGAEAGIIERGGT